MQTGSHGLKRELRLRDLVPMQIAIVTYLGWIGFAAKQGATQVALWFLAILFFYLPLAVVVIKLSREIPVEGGVYQWVKTGFSPFAAYIAAWNLTIYALFAFATVGSVLAEGFAHAAGPRGAWMGTNRWFAVAVMATACLIAYAFNARGLRIAKFWSSAGTAATVVAFVALMFLLAKAWLTHAPLAHNSFSLALPAFSILTLNVFTKMAIGALSGFDSSAVFAEECRKPENDVSRSVLVAAPLIALMYILGTSAMLAYVEPAQAELASPVVQAMQAGFGVRGVGGALTILATAAISIAFVAAMVIFVGAIARLPMVVGWDGLLPPWWSELHPRFRTPTKAIGCVVVSILALSILMLVGAGNEEAVQVGIAASNAGLALVYTLLFGVALFGFRAIPVNLGMGVRLAAFPALLVSLVALALEMFPLGAVANTAIFGMKVAATVIGANALGAYLYWLGIRRSGRRNAMAGET